MTQKSIWARTECSVSHHEREKMKLLQRVRKLRGQLDAVERSLTADEDCGGQLMLLAAVRGGVNGLMGEVLENIARGIDCEAIRQPLGV